MASQEELIMAEVNEVLVLEQTMAEQISTIKATQERIDDFWKSVQARMIEHEIKNIKGDWGTLTIAERIGFDVDEAQLPTKFWKKVIDSKKLADTYRLEGKAPKGTQVKFTRYLTKRIKSQMVNEIVKGTSN
ncbi:MAG TPA: hypothetical protein VGN15_13860 [Ktedonobacteraceae bacterium]|jgi:hypothetical protein|nr:hypothetical protein [Ktedonobacteraceae bacterium]